jgi:hypothetical protein
MPFASVAVVQLSLTLFLDACPLRIVFEGGIESKMIDAE